MRLLTIILVSGLAFPLPAQTRPRARDLGIPLDGTPGMLNAITDVAGVEVGHTTIIRGEGKLVRGQGPVRTGVTAVLPRGKNSDDNVMAAWFTLNGNGEMTGTTWVEESGFLGGPIMITNTHSVGIVHDAVIEWIVQRGKSFDWSLPVVAETWDGTLNDINGFHVTKEHTFAALDSARSGRVTEGNVGGGTGMICHGFKGGIGTASRKLETGGWTVGVLVQCNYGGRRALRIAGTPWASLPDWQEPAACYSIDPPAGSRLPRCGQAPGREEPAEMGSIIIVVATDAPLLPHQLKRLVKRASLGIGRMGGIGANSSGDIFVAFSTANPASDVASGTATVKMLSNNEINGLFQATIDATEESILNAMLAATDMTGADGVRIPALPHDKVKELLRKHARTAGR
ncbi:MAG TPA: P1 family peptidase [Gemmatimonadales bacterium]|nr:P1 family peptidase [Gemmatimonadales bacterium]